METNIHNTKPNSVNGRRLAFDQFELDPANRVLLREGQEVPLTGKAFDVLLAFVKYPNRLLSKDDLIEMVWQNDFVEEGNVARHVSTLRKALGDLPSEQKYISTVQGRGYKFVACVTEISDSLSAIDLKSSEKGLIETVAGSSAAKFVLHARQRPALFVLSIAVCLGVVLLTTSLIYRAPFFTARTQSIAVLPFRPVNPGDQDLIYQCGMAESLIVRLGAANGVTVRPLSAIRKYSDVEQDALTAGREQQVDHVLDSNYQLVNGKIRILSQLLNVRTGAVEQTVRVEKDSADVFTMQDAIAAEIGNSLLTQLGKVASSKAAKHYTTNEEAYRIYLQGMILADKRNGRDAPKAVELFEQAVKLDPNYALAWAGLAYAHRTVSIFGGVPAEEYTLSKEAVDRALELDPDLAEAHTILGEIKSTYEWDHAGAEREHRCAIELDPGSAFAHRFYALHLINLTRFDEAVAESKIAIDLDPHSVFDQRNLGMILYFAGRYDEAITQLNRVIEMDATHNSANFWLSACYEQKREYDQALQWFIQGASNQKDLDAKSADWLNSLKDAYAKDGWEGFLRRRLEENTNDPMDLAGLYARLGDKDRAFENLEKAYQDHESSLIWLRIVPAFNSLHSDPRFDDLVARVGLKNG